MQSLSEQVTYEPYLQSVYPGTSWAFEKLTGGIVNSTLRATCTSSTTASAPKSLIIKHARPYVAAIGPEFTFSTERQTVEATFLSLWNEGGLLHDIKQTSPSWITPQLLRHDHGVERTLGLSASDQRASIILLSDLGNLTNIADVIRQSAAGTRTVSLNQIRQLGTAVGTIIATLHAPETRDAAAPVSQSLAHDLTQDIVWSAVVQPMKPRLNKATNSEKLYQIIVDEFREPKHKYREALSMGDLNPGSVLLVDGSNDLTPILVDWEFGSSNGRGVNGDTAQFLASFHCEVVGAKGNEMLTARFTAFLDAFCKGYREKAALGYTGDAKDEMLQLMRSTFALHGREMVNHAFDDHNASPHFDEMVDMGLWYLERSGLDGEEFVSDANWSDLPNEDLMLIQSLFTLHE